jgi:hypothetical protein
MHKMPALVHVTTHEKPENSRRISDTGRPLGKTVSLPLLK